MKLRDSFVAHKTSMLQDLELGRPMEIDALVAVIQELGRLVEIPTPTTDVVLALIQLRFEAGFAYFQKAPKIREFGDLAHLTSCPFGAKRSEFPPPVPPRSPRRWGGLRPDPLDSVPRCRVYLLGNWRSGSCCRSA